MISKKLITSTLLYTLGGALPMLSGLVLLPVLIANLPETVYGSFTLLQMVILFFSVIGVLNTDTSMQLYAFEYKNDKDKLAQFMGTLLTTMLATGLIVVAIVSLIGPFLFESILGKDIPFYPFGLLALAAGFFYAFFKAYTTFLIIQERAWIFFWLNVLVFGITLGLSYWLVNVQKDLMAPMIGRVFPLLLAFILVLILFLRQFSFSWDRKLVQNIFVFSFPILLHSLILWLVGNVHGLIINKNMDKVDVGVFDLAVKCSLALEFLLTGLANAVFPKIFNIWSRTSNASSSQEENRYHHVFTLITILSIAALNLALPIGVMLLVKKAVYFDALIYAPFILLGFAFRGLYNAYNLPITYFKQTKALPRIAFAMGVSQLVLGILLIRYFGLPGAVAAILFTRFLQIALTWYHARKFFKFKFNNIKMVGLPVLYAVFVVVGELFFTEINKILIYAVEFILISVFIVIVFYPEIKNIIRTKKLI